ncbi:MAG: S9 family peptidase, partial [Candidatus Neomarinimicrobiota bacterium]
GYREVPSYTIEQFYDTISIGGGSFSHDDAHILFHSNQTGIYNAYTIPVSGGEPTAVTRSEVNAFFAVSTFPTDDRLLLRGDKGGNEIWHIYLRDGDGELTDLTPGEEARSLFSQWSHAGSSFFFTSNRRDARKMDLYEMDINGFRDALVFENEEGYSFGAITDDKRYLALVKTITTHNSDMYVYDRETEELRHLSPHDGAVNYFPVAFTPDGASLYYLTDEGSEFSHLRLYDLAGGESKTVAAPDWDVMYAYLSWAGTYLVLGVNVDARTDTRVIDRASGRRVKLPRLPDGEITSVRISRSEDWMLFYHTGSTSPNNLYSYRFASGKHTRLTDTMTPEIDQANLVSAKVIRYPSYDGLEIPSILYRPWQIKSGEQAPALVWVHGGPGSQSRVRYSSLIQYLVNHGYVVLAVNNRGSSGYGKSFYKLDDRRHGEDDLADCVQGKEFLIGTGYVDPDRIGIIGGSYGGYMTLAALTFQPDEFAVGVDLFGISNWVRTLESIPPWWEAFKDALYEELGDPAEDHERLLRISPLFHAEQIRRPLMVLQGANDPRVLKVESDEIVAAVRDNNVPVEYLVFDDEGHGFVKKENQIEGYRAILAFLDTHLKGEVAPLSP